MQEDSNYVARNLFIFHYCAMNAKYAVANKTTMPSQKNPLPDPMAAELTRVFFSMSVWS
jgi:hypothetical protein